ncbi:MAG: L-lactate permease, partial [Mycolicibacterium sp.]|nr:L-lactate permease [Mycolicibacterium sp.]
MLPLLTIFVTLGLLRWKAHVAALAALAVSIAVAIAAYGMPPQLALLSASEGAAFGLFPIMWIVFAAIWLYQITVVSGRFEDLRAAFHLLSDDPRVQAIVVAFCFGGLLEALAGFGAPIAITAIMLMGLGFSALRAAVVVLLANTAPVAFGAIGVPIITAGNLTGIPFTEIGAYVGRQTPLLAAIVPLLLVLLVDGRRGVRQTWPVAVVVGIVFAVAQFVSSNYISVELTDIIASLAGLAAAAVMLRFWQPVGGDDALHRLEAEHHQELAVTSPAGSPAQSGGTATATTETRTIAEHAAGLTGGRIVMALFPYLLVIAVFALAKLWHPLSDFLVGRDVKIHWPGLDGHVLTAAGKPAGSTVYTFQWLSSPGTLLVICGCIVALVYHVSARAALKE